MKKIYKKMKNSKKIENFYFLKNREKQFAGNILFAKEKKIRNL